MVNILLSSKYGCIRWCIFIGKVYAILSSTKKRYPKRSISRNVLYCVEQGGTVEKPWPPVASWTGGAQRSWEGFSFSTVPPCDYLLSAVATSTAQATVQPTIGLLPMPRNPIISTCAGTDAKPRAIKLVWIAEVRRRKSPEGLTDEEPANCASECIRPIVSVR